ncbi:MAG TPA: peptidoglycan-binding domain-containing protein [Acidimicrobiales bacterium]|nr:peptidoglycan-binding domain-containing protein [Acidimicrobiales bacterium]
MSDLILETPGSSAGLVQHLSDAWVRHVEASTGDRPAAPAALLRLEHRLEAWVADAAPLTLSSLRVLPRALSAWLDARSGAAQARVAQALVVVIAAMTAAGVIGAAAIHDSGSVSLHRLAGNVALRSDGPKPTAPAPGAPMAATALPSALKPRAQAIAPAPTVPTVRGPLPVGKGMWMWMPERAEGGNPQAVIHRAQAAGLSHIYVRTGSSRMGFYPHQYLNDLLPRAHAAGIRVYGWDFPYLEDPQADVARAVEAIRYRTPDGHGIDGFTADIETRGEGVNINPGTAAAYGTGLRQAVGPLYPLIATTPRPSAALVTYPWPEVVAHFDAIAPMVYWLNRQPDTDLAAAMTWLKQFNKPLIPVGQAYDGTAEGGRSGVPTRAELQAFMRTGDEHGAIGVSFWSWQHADEQAWDAIRDAPQFTLPATPPGAPVAFTPGQVRSYQALLASLGFGVPTTGRWDTTTSAVVSAYQAAAGLPVTGIIDHATRNMMLRPFAAPIG